MGKEVACSGVKTSADEQRKFMIHLGARVLHRHYDDFNLDWDLPGKAIFLRPRMGNKEEGESFRLCGADLKRVSELFFQCKLIAIGCSTDNPDDDLEIEQLH